MYKVKTMLRLFKVTLVQCCICGAAVATDADRCPSCRTKYPGKKRVKNIQRPLIIAVILYIAVRIIIENKERLVKFFSIIF